MTTYKVGDRVEFKRNNQGNRKRKSPGWYRGVVLKVSSSERLYLEYDDAGTIRRGIVATDNVRKLKDGVH